jgi:hypothetical protein
MTDVVQIDVTKLTPLSPEVISKQATINIGKLSPTPSHYKSVARKKSNVFKVIKFLHGLISLNYRYYWSRSSR